MSRISEYGPGDEQTWGPVTKHPFDPRYDAEADDYMTVADGFEFEPEKVIEAINDLECIEPEALGAALVAFLTEQQREPLRALLRKRLEYLAELHIEERNDKDASEAADAYMEMRSAA